MEATSQVCAAGLMFQDIALAEFGRQGRSGDTYRATENFHAKAVFFEVCAKFALAIYGHGGIGNLDVISVCVLGLKRIVRLCPR